MAPSSSPQASPAIGGRYAIQRKLGAGSIGTVYLALDSRAGRPVALKVLRPDHFSAGAVERFRREFGAIAALRHPQIAEAFDFGYTDGGLPYYTREYIEGTPCAAGPPAGAPPAEFLEPILDLLEALEYLHAHGILHLDIHPGNLIVARNSSRGSVLIDFGLFRSGSGPRLTRALDSTQPFVPPPPEVLRGERLGPATDLFLAGRLLLHRLAGELAGEARLPREIPGWGARRTLELERISAKALAEDPARRFRSAGLLVRPLLPAAARRLLIAVVASRSQTLRVPKDIASRAVAAAKGSPLLLRRIARALADEWGRAGSIPAGADIPELSRDPIAAGLAPLQRTGERERAVLQALALLDRAATRQEVARAIDRTPHAISAPLRRLELEELVAARGKGAARRYELSRPGAAEVLARETPPEEARRLHRRLARFLAGQPRRGPREAEDLARHLLRGGRKPAGTREAFRAVRLLRGAGCHERAISLLEEVLAGEPDPRRKFHLLEELSSLVEEIGDHEKGVALLDPFHRKALRLLPAREGVRLRRRLGVHFHRAGRAEAAARILEEAARIADPTLDREDLIVIDSELAELHTLRGRLDEADAACRRGLERLTGLRSGDAFRGRMEVILRASRGHLELRRLRVAEAREEFRVALHLAKGFRMPAIRAVILNNLGIAESQLNRLAAARIAFREAEALFLAAGEKRSVIIIAGNLAVIAAKLGDREEARREIERAERLLRTAPAERLEFSVAYGRGVAAALLGDGEEVLEVMPAALALGQRLGDAHLTRYGEVYLAEARMACGRLEEARYGLTALAQQAERDGPPILTRMAQSRLFLLARLLGQEGAAERSRRRLQGLPRGDMEYLEAWCDLFEGFALALPARSPQKHLSASTRPPGSEPPETVRSAKRVLGDARLAFRRLRLLSGERAARLALLFEALSRKDAGSVETELRSLRADEARSGQVRHRFLEVARPLLLAEAHFFLGHPQEAQDLLSEASGAIIGSSFLELDWRIEFLRTRLALRSGDATAARAHFHRALHTRDLLGRLVSGPGRNRFLAQPRFRDLEALAPRLERSPRLASSSVRDDGGSYQGMVGRSRQMVEVFRTIDRLREQELPILITGEIGTGKELVARALHRTSPRGSGPFLALHAGSLPVELFEAELFGHEKGAFSGAEEERPGLLESLAGGTLLLDEVTALPLAAQAKLLRVLATGRARRLGATGERAVDVRFLASAGVNLAERVRAGEFREDLLNRLRVVEIRLPPLRERQGDHAVLAQRFLEIHARRLGRPVPTLAPSAIAALEAQNWRGNVRELETVVLRALSSLSPFLSLGAMELQPLLSREGGEGTGADETILRRILTEDLPLGELRRRFERFYLLRLFRRVNGDPKKMMEILGVTQSYLYGRLKKLGIDVRTLRKELEL